MVPPVPIPNTEVKHFSADGTAWGTMWESRSPPKLLETSVLCTGVFFLYTHACFTCMLNLFSELEVRAHTFH